jgi:hypothetical protein
MPEQESHQKSLRLGRFDESGFCYFLTTVTKKRRPIFLEKGLGLIFVGAPSLRLRSGQAWCDNLFFFSFPTLQNLR